MADEVTETKDKLYRLVDLMEEEDDHGGEMVVSHPHSILHDPYTVCRDDGKLLVSTRAMIYIYPWNGLRV